MYLLWKTGQSTPQKTLGQGNLIIEDPHRFDNESFDYITSIEQFSAVATRQEGVYQHKSAEVSLALNKEQYVLHMKYKTLADGKEALSLIMTGQICPQFSISTKQGPSSPDTEGDDNKVITFPTENTPPEA